MRASDPSGPCGARDRAGRPRGGGRGRVCDRKHAGAPAGTVTLAGRLALGDGQEATTPSGRGAGGRSEVCGAGAQGPEAAAGRPGRVYRSASCALATPGASVICAANIFFRSVTYLLAFP